MISIRFRGLSLWLCASLLAPGVLFGGQEPAPAQGPAPAPTQAPNGGLGGAPPSPDVARTAERNAALPAQVGVRRSAGIGREQMWPAPTAEDWAQPCLIRWQRSWADAVALSQETGKPILVAVNMDGEIASEHYAGVRYREPAAAALFEPYVCVIASVYRHTPSDYDAQGERVECPRFGTVTCGEHVAIEPGLFDRYFHDQRVAPRHIMVELEGQAVYDVFYALDTASVFDTIREGIETRTRQPLPEPSGDRSLEQLVASPDSADREWVEQLYREGSDAQRRELLRAAQAARGRASVDLLRIAIFGLDLELADMARTALTHTESEQGIDLILEALRVPLDTADREALVATLERLGESSDRARTLAAVQRGLQATSNTIDLEGWNRTLPQARAGYASSAERADRFAAITARLAALDARPSSAEPDAVERLEFAEAQLAYAIEPQSWQAAGGGARPVRGASADRFLQLLLEEALAAALEAEARGASGWRVDAAVALASHYLGDRATAGLRAERAVAALPVGVTDWNAMAVLALFADERQQAIRTAIRAREEWPREWMSDVHSAYTVLGAHPEGTAELAVAHFDFLLWMGAFERAGEVLGAALARFPTAAPVHDRWRGQELRRGGAPRLEQSYRELLAGEHPPAVAAELSWYAGYASLVAAEFHRRRTELDLAHASYERALAAFAACVEQAPALEQTSAHYQAMARAGQARLFLDQGQWEQATAHLVAAIEWHPAAADALDGLNQSMVATATTLRAQLVAAELVDQVARIDAALALLTPEQLLPAPYDRVGPPTRTADGRRPLGEEPPR